MTPMSLPLGRRALGRALGNKALSSKPGTVTFVLQGAPGSAGYTETGKASTAPGAGGKGGLLVFRAKKSALPASVIVQVGQGGQRAAAQVQALGGWPAGGDGYWDGSNSYSAGSGGGRSAIFDGSVSQDKAIGVAAGGAGGSSANGGDGGNGGYPAGSDGTGGSSGTGGTGGSQTAGGTTGGAALQGADGVSNTGASALYTYTGANQVHVF